jgi:hypothetical protein
VRIHHLARGWKVEPDLKQLQPVAENGLFVHVFSVFVPSLSWQIFGFAIKWTRGAQQQRWPAVAAAAAIREQAAL